MPKLLSSTQKQSKKKVASGAVSSSSPRNKSKLPKSAPQPFRNTKTKGGGKKAISRTKTSNNAKRNGEANVDMDTYIEDLLNDDKAIDVLVGSLTDNSNRIIRYHIKEFPDSYCSITITAPYSKQKWAIYVPIAEDLKEILNIWRRLPRLERREMLGAWILRSSNLDFDANGHISGINFEHKPFRQSCRQHFFVMINTFIAPMIQATARRYLARKRVARIRLQRQQQQEEEQKKRDEKPRRRKGSKNTKKHSQSLHMRIGSTLESSTNLDDDASSFLSLRTDDEEVEEDEALQQVLQQKVKEDHTSAEEVEDDISVPLKKQPLNTSDVVEEVEEDILPGIRKLSVGGAEEGKEIERTREINYLSKPVIKKKKKRRKSSTSSLNSSDGESLVRKENEDDYTSTEFTEPEDNFPFDRKLSVDKSPVARKKSIKTLAPAENPSESPSPSAVKMRKSIIASPSHSKSPTKSRPSRYPSPPKHVSPYDSPILRGRSLSSPSGRKMSMDELIIENEPKSALTGVLTSMPEPENDDILKPSGDSETENLADEINELRDLVQSQMSSFISEVGALTVSIQNNGAAKRAADIGSHVTPMGSVVLPPEGNNVQEESKLMEFEGMKSEILELRHLVDSLQKNAGSVELKPPHQTNEEENMKLSHQKQGEFEEAQGNQKKEMGILSAETVSDETVINVAVSEALGDGLEKRDFTRISISSGGEKEDMFEMSGIYPPLSQQSHRTPISSPSPPLELQQEQENIDVNQDENGRRVVPDWTGGEDDLPPRSSSQLEQIVEETSISSNMPSPTEEPTEEAFERSVEFSSTNGDSLVSAVNQEDSRPSTDADGKKKKKKKKKKNRSPSPVKIVSDTDMFVNALKTQNSISEERGGDSIYSMTNNVDDEEANFDALNEADDKLRQELSVYKSKSDKEEKNRRRLKKRSLALIVKFVTKMMKKRFRKKALEKSFEKHADSALKTAVDEIGGEIPKIRSLKDLCEDLERSLEFGSVKLAALTILDVNAFFLTSRRVQSIIAVQKECPNFSQLFVTFLYSFLGVSSVLFDAFISLTHCIKKRLLVVELLNDGVIECLMTIAVRYYNHYDLIDEIFNIFAFILEDIPDEYTVALIMTPEALNLFKKLVPKVTEQDHDVAFKIFSFINKICVENSSMVAGFANVDFYDVLADTCFDLVDSPEILTFSLWTCSLFVAHRPGFVQSFNNKGHVELIVECILLYTGENTEIALKYFHIVVGLFLSLSDSCSDFIRLFPAHHFLSTIMIPLQYREGNIFSEAVLTLLKSLLMKYPVLRTKFHLVQFSDVLVPFITDHEESESVVEAALSLQLIIHPEWEIEQKKSSGLPSRNSSRRSVPSTPNRLHVVSRGSRSRSSTRGKSARRRSPNIDQPRLKTIADFSSPLNRRVPSPLGGLVDRQKTPSTKDKPKNRRDESSDAHNASSLLQSWKDENELQLFNATRMDSAGVRFNSADHGIRLSSADPGFRLSSADPGFRRNSAELGFSAEGRRLNSAGLGSNLNSDSEKINSAGSESMQFSATPPVRSLMNFGSSLPSSAHVPRTPKSPKPSSTRPGSRHLQMMSKARALSMITPVVFRHITRMRIAKAKMDKSKYSDEEEKKKKRNIKRAKSEALALLESEQEVEREKEEYRRIKTEEDKKRAEKARERAAKMAKEEGMSEDASMLRIVFEEQESLDRILFGKSRNSGSRSSKKKAKKDKKSKEKKKKKREEDDQPNEVEVELDKKEKEKHNQKEQEQEQEKEKEKEKEKEPEAEIVKNAEQHPKDNLKDDDDGDKNKRMDRQEEGEKKPEEIQKENEKVVDTEKGTIPRTVLKSAQNDMDAEVCVQDMTSALHDNNGEAFLAMLKIIFRLAKTELKETTNGDASALLFASRDVVVAGGKQFVNDRTIIGSILEALWLFKSKMKKSLDMKENDLFNILREILRLYIGEVHVCKHIVRLHDKRSLQLVDNDFITLVIGMLKRHAQDEVIQKESINILKLCVARESSFQTAVYEAGGCALILDLYSMQAKHIELSDIVNLILMLTADHADNASYFGTMGSVMIFTEALLHNTHSESAFNLGTVLVFYALKTFSDPTTFFLDASFLEPINKLFALAEEKEGGIDEQLLEWILKFVRELCTIPSSKALFVRSHFNAVLSQFMSPEHSKGMRKLAMSIIKKMTD